METQEKMKRKREKMPHETPASGASLRVSGQVTTRGVCGRGEEGKLPSSNGRKVNLFPTTQVKRGGRNSRGRKRKREARAAAARRVSFGFRKHYGRILHEGTRREADSQKGRTGKNEKKT